MQKHSKQINDALSQMVSDPEMEKEIALDNFRHNLMVFLDASSQDFFDILFDYNAILILMMATDSAFLMNLQKALRGNDERLTVDNIKVGDTVKDPTISNWITDFIKFHGSNIFNNVILSKYMTSSPNVTRLKYNERRLVKKLLTLYRNLTFFPDSLKDIPQEYWEIIPVDREVNKVSESKFLGIPKTEEEKEIDQLKNMEENYQEGSLEQLALEEEIVNKKRVEELKMMAKKYKEGSLERRVVEEEIGKLES